MADLTVKNPQTTEAYLAAMAREDVVLPVNIGKMLGVVYDATGRDVFTVDSNGERPDAETERIALWICLAINTCGGFMASAPKPDLHLVR